MKNVVNLYKKAKQSHNRQTGKDSFVKCLNLTLLWSMPPPIPGVMELESYILAGKKSD